MTPLTKQDIDDLRKLYSVVPGMEGKLGAALALAEEALGTAQGESEPVGWVWPLNPGWGFTNNAPVPGVDRPGLHRPVYLHPAPTDGAKVREADWWKSMLQAVVVELAAAKKWDKYPEVWDKEENAPGHGHSAVGIWDSDNGIKAGKPCSWCIAWNAARKALAELGEVKP